MARDRHRCGYCGGQATTIDHVLPRSRGGRNTWLNTVAACGGCNQRKGDRTPAEARMSLRVTPYAPTWATLAAR
jgi:5-methylcytosine-specific restriction endonuclease McrA